MSVNSQSITEVYVEAQRHFMGEGKLNDTLSRLVRDLHAHDIDYMVIGALAIDGINFPTLEKLIELKLASGMTAPDRLKDLADVQELIKIRGLSADYAAQLDPYVRTKFLELVNTVEIGRRNHIEE